MQPRPQPAAASSACQVDAITLGVAARGAARLTLAELVEIRDNPPASFGPRITRSLLKHSDDQTLASLIAVGDAIGQSEVSGEDFDSWAVVSTSRFLGRATSAALIHKYEHDGPWGVSVQVIPHRSPHAVSGLVSLALGCHGPAISVGGGVGEEHCVLMAGACLLREPSCAGVWALFSAWTPELAVDREGQPIGQAVCEAVAIALVPQPTSTCIGQIRIVNCEAPGRPPASETASNPLTNFLLQASWDRVRWSYRPSENLQLELDLTSAAHRASTPSGKYKPHATGRSAAKAVVCAE